MIDTGDVDIFLDLDVGKGEHHGTAAPRTGKRAIDKRLPNSEPTMRPCWTSSPPSTAPSRSWSTSPPHRHPAPRRRPPAAAPPARPARRTRHPLSAATAAAVPPSTPGQATAIHRIRSTRIRRGAVISDVLIAAMTPSGRTRLQSRPHWTVCTSGPTPGRAFRHHPADGPGRDSPTSSTGPPAGDRARTRLPPRSGNRARMAFNQRHAEYMPHPPSATSRGSPSPLPRRARPPATGAAAEANSPTSPGPSGLAGPVSMPVWIRAPMPIVTTRPVE